MTEMKKNTKEQILLTALKLFNKSGSHSVTTNHIAEEMGISPGNLYYHYKNKEHIIREILISMIEDFDLIWKKDADHKFSITDIAEITDRSCDIIYRYRFFYIELSTLLSRDEELSRIYTKIKRDRTKDFETIFHLVESAGLWEKPIPLNERSSLIFIAWSYIESIMTSMQTSNIKITKPNLKKEISRAVYLIKPYLKPEFRNMINVPI